MQKIDLIILTGNICSECEYCVHDAILLLSKIHQSILISLLDRIQAKEERICTIVLQSNFIPAFSIRKVKRVTKKCSDKVTQRHSISTLYTCCVRIREAVIYVLAEFVR